MAVAVSPNGEISPLAPLFASRRVHQLVRGPVMSVRRGFPVPAGLLRGSWPDPATDCICDRIGNGDPASVGAAHRATCRPPTDMARNLIGLRGRRRRDGARLSAGGPPPTGSSGGGDTVFLPWCGR